MKQFYLKPFNSPSFYDNKIFRINNGDNIFYLSDDRLKKYDIKIATIDNDTGDGDCYIFCDLPYPWEFNLWKKLFTIKGKKVLFVFESPIVNPFNHLKFLYSLFDRVYTWDNSIKKNNRVIAFRIPQLNRRELRIKSFSERSKFVSLINSNKLSPSLFKLISPYKFDGYTERLKAIEFFEKKHPDDFHLYGRGWNAPRKLSLKDKIFGYKKFNTYRGTTNDKYEELNDSKFCICYENAIAPGYFTEKIFDCLQAGCIPIYIGPTDIDHFIPKEAYINKNNFASYEDLYEYIKQIDNESAKKYLSAAEKFLNSADTKNIYYEDSFINILVNLASI